MSYVPQVEPVAHQLGFLTLNENGAILSSGGDLENDEGKAEILYKLVTIHNKVDKYLEDGCTRISVNFKDHAYVVCVSNKKIHIIKKSIYLTEEVEEEPYFADTNISITNSINA